MKRHDSFQIAISVSISLLVLALAHAAGPVGAQDGPGATIPFSAEEPVIIESVSHTVVEGEALFEPGEEPDRLTVTITGTLPFKDNIACFVCVEMITLAPEVSVPLAVFFADTDVMLEAIVMGGTGSISYGVKKDDSGYNVIDQTSGEYIFEGMILDAYAPTAEAEELIISGPDGATLRKEDNGFWLVEGSADYIAAASAVAPVSEPTLVITLSTIDDPATPLELTVASGDYQLVNGATLREGSVVRVVEDWLTFPPGLAIDVGAGGVTLDGIRYEEGARLLTDADGALSEASVTEAAQPTYSDVVASYPADADLCNTDATLVGETADGWRFGGGGTLSIRNGAYTYHCYGAKITLDIATTWDDGVAYPAGTLLTVDADLNWIAVSSWD